MATPIKPADKDVGILLGRNEIERMLDGIEALRQHGEIPETQASDLKQRIEDGFFSEEDFIKLGEMVVPVQARLASISAQLATHLKDGMDDTDKAKAADLEIQRQKAAGASHMAEWVFSQAAGLVGPGLIDPGALKKSEIIQSSIQEAAAAAPSRFLGAARISKDFSFYVAKVNGELRAFADKNGKLTRLKVLDHPGFDKKGNTQSSAATVTTELGSLFIHQTGRVEYAPLGGRFDPNTQPIAADDAYSKAIAELIKSPELDAPGKSVPSPEKPGLLEKLQPLYLGKVGDDTLYVDGPTVAESRAFLLKDGEVEELKLDGPIAQRKDGGITVPSKKYGFYFLNPVGSQEKGFWRLNGRMIEIDALDVKDAKSLEVINGLGLLGGGTPPPAQEAPPEAERVAKGGVFIPDWV